MMVDAMARGGTRNHTGEWPAGSRYWKPAHDYVCAQLAGAATPHLHDEWQFAVPSQAAALLLGGFAHHPARAGHVVMVRPYDVHAESAGVSWSVLYVARGVVARHFRALEVLAVPSRTVADPAMGSELAALLRHSGDGVTTEAEFAASALDWLEGFARRATADPAPRRSRRPRPAVERARAHLIGRPAEAPSLQEMASVAGVGASHLVRTFSLDIGLPPRSYHVQARLALARRLLGEGRPVTWVAYECGFADQSHLSRRFKASYGLTPGSFQAQCMRHSAPASGSDAA